jgi:hypothetical protein
MKDRTNETKSLPNKFVLTTEQKIALLEAKIQRAESYLASIRQLIKQSGKR